MHRGKSAAVALAATAALLGTAGLAQADGSAPASSPAATPNADGTGADGKGGDGKRGDGKGAKGRGKGGKVTGDGAKALCKRAPKIDRRLERALKRLRGPETRRGSIARVKKRAENAKKAGHTEIATFLNDRLKFRKALVPTLEKRQKDLAKVQKWCTAHHHGSAS
ncbi:hypothetical protein HUT19_19475 [Streptomyces sp. NA02950]|uniref:hypothetical protein n=1 Tax=Streptomyces sp. NA02950 TaxID=2742137 RepID=UPI0015903C9B|nr:hypothetical protein [Streptomyces sp. NA02950]QKV93668.1 hypothetical protein HUT19_19475 [Streptomyces sp. NA02950]